MVRAARRSARDQRSAQEREEAAAALRDHLAPVLDRLPPGAVVSSYTAWKTEPPTHLLNADVRARGLDLILPVVLDDLDLDWARPESEERLGVDIIGTAHLLLMPALAIAKDGMRLGQGGGCYDRVLLRVREEVPLVAIVHDDEVTARVPKEPHDRPVDGVVTPRGGLRTFPSWQQSSLKN